MKVVVFGSTGPTGLLIVQQALAKGHHVKAFVRTPSKMTVTGENLERFRGDIYDKDSVENAIEGCDAVICTVGVPFTRKPVSVYSTAAHHIINGMEKHQLQRFITITSGGTYPGRDPDNPFFFERILKPIFHTLYDDMREMEQIVMATNLAWTILRPPRLLDKPRTENIRIDVDRYAIKGHSTISRADLADVVVQELESDGYIQKAIAVAS